MFNRDNDMRSPISRKLDFTVIFVDTLACSEITCWELIHEYKDEVKRLAFHKKSLEFIIQLILKTEYNLLLVYINKMVHMCSMHENNVFDDHCNSCKS